MRGCGALGKTDKGAKPVPRKHESVGPANRHAVDRPEPLSNPDAKRYGGPPATKDEYITTRDHQNDFWRSSNPNVASPLRLQAYTKENGIKLAFLPLPFYG